MRIQFDSASSEINYPIDQATVKRALAGAVPRPMIDRISKIRFGCNRSTTQEARIVERGDSYEIRVNFCLVRGRSKLLSDKPAWVSVVERCGGIIDKEASEISWSPDAARRYAVFLLMHEIGHVMYSEDHGHESLQAFASSSAEEKWCEGFAHRALERLSGLL